MAVRVKGLTVTFTGYDRDLLLQLARLAKKSPQVTFIRIMNKFLKSKSV